MKQKKGANYAMFADLLDFLETNPSKKELLLKVHEILDKRHAYGYEHVAWSAKNQLDLLIAEKKLAEQNSITIEVEGGVVVDVRNLPAGLDYLIDDKDAQACGEGPPE